MRNPLGLLLSARRLPVLIGVPAGALLVLFVSPDLATAQSGDTDAEPGPTEQATGFRPVDPDGSAIDPSDVVSPEALVATLYEVISGPADEERDWDRLRSLFLPEARLTIARWQTADGPVEQVRSAEVEGFIAAAGASYRQDGFWEREIWSRTEQFGNVAHVFSTYASRVGSEASEPVQRGINSFQLVRTDGRWWITSIAWDVEGPGNPIPETYLPD